MYTQQAGGRCDWAQHLSPRGKELGALRAVGGIQAEDFRDLIVLETARGALFLVHKWSGGEQREKATKAELWDPDRNSSGFLVKKEKAGTVLSNGFN